MLTWLIVDKMEDVSILVVAEKEPQVVTAEVHVPPMCSGSAIFVVFNVFAFIIVRIHTEPINSNRES